MHSPWRTRNACRPPQRYRPGAPCDESVEVTLCVFDRRGCAIDSDPVGTTDFCYPCSVFKDAAVVLAHSGRFPRDQEFSVQALNPLRRVHLPHLVLSTRSRQRNVPLTSNRPRHHAPVDLEPALVPSWSYPPAPPCGLRAGSSATRLDAFAPDRPMNFRHPSPMRVPAVSTNPWRNRLAFGSIAVAAD